MRLLRSLPAVVAFVALVTGLSAAATPQLFGSSAEQQQPTIVSSAELSQYVSQDSSDASPLAALSPEAKQRFLGSLRFTSRGLASFSMDDLSALTATQAYAILHLFGAESYLKAVEPRIVTSEDQSLINSDVHPDVVLYNYICEESRAIACPLHDKFVLRIANRFSGYQYLDRSALWGGAQSSLLGSRRWLVSDSSSCFQLEIKFERNPRSANICRRSNSRRNLPTRLLGAPWATPSACPMQSGLPHSRLTANCVSYRTTISDSYFARLTMHLKPPKISNISATCLEICRR